QGNESKCKPCANAGHQPAPKSRRQGHRIETNSTAYSKQNLRVAPATLEESPQRHSRSLHKNRSLLYGSSPPRHTFVSAPCPSHKSPATVARETPVPYSDKHRRPLKSHSLKEIQSSAHNKACQEFRDQRK